MRTLLVLRHGKAQPDAPHGDHARELTERGRKDAKAIGAIIRSMVGIPDAIVTSDATRALQTAELAAVASGYASSLIVQPGIYDADADYLVEVVQKLPAIAHCVVIVGHNPGFLTLAQMLAFPGSDIETLPTSGLAHLEFDGERWEDVLPGTCKLLGMTSANTGDGLV